MRKSLFAAGSGLVLAVLLLSLTSAAASGQGVAGPPFRPGEVVVGGVLEGAGPDLHTLKYLPNADLTVVGVERGREFAMVRKFRDRGRRASLNFIARASLVPADPYYSPYQWNFPAVQSEAAWDIGSGAGVTVAVLDTGLALGGNDGLNCVTTPWDVVNNDGDPDDGNGHGTHVAGTIAQTTGNGTGVAGLAYSACVMPVKVLNDNGSGSFADIAEGLHYAVNHGAAVINMSLGTDARFGLRNDQIMDAALDYADASGVTVVCAAGNEASRKNVGYPAIYPTTIAVGATDFLNRVTRYSNKGEGLDLVAPGGDLRNDRNSDGYPDGILQETRIDGSWAYYFFEGTSMATPHVAAAAALLISNQPALTPAEVYQTLTTTTLDLGEAGYDPTSGHGLLQIHRALTGEQNTGGNGIDADGDGWTVENGDCDDTNADVYPGHQDSKGRFGRDGIDNDCNGIIDG